jgi:energy-coupling factor transport system ATP-binding protein
MMGRLVLEVSDLWVRYPRGDWVLRGIDLQVNRGEQVLVIGDTGSGKTTLARAITGLAKTIYECDVKGRILLSGMEVDGMHCEVLSRHVALVGQNPYLYFIEPLVGDDLYGYALKVHCDGRLASDAFNKVVDAMGIRRLTERFFFEISGGEARRALVAKAIISNASLLIFDEPLMWLDDRGVEDFVDLLEMLRRLERTVMIFEHRFVPLLKRVDKVYVLKDGKLADVTSRALTTFERLSHQLPHGFYFEKKTGKGDLLLEAKDVYFKYDAKSDYLLKGIDLQLCRGDVVLIYGLNGQGKTTLLKILAGYLKPHKGKVLRRGSVLYIPQNIALFYTESTIEKEVVEVFKAWGMKTKAKVGLDVVRGLNIDPLSSPFSLSHGQMVKLAVGLASALDVDVLLLDEPFSGLTYDDRLKLLELLYQSNSAVVVATSSLDATEAPYWTKLYKLEEGRLVEMRAIEKASLIRASRLYRELVGVESA